MTGPSDKSERRRALVAAVARAAAAVAAVFTTAVALLLVVNYAGLRRADPLNSRALLELRARFDAQPDAERLKEDIRMLDLAARRVFFTSQSQIRVGGIMLAAGVFALVLCLQVLAETGSVVRRPDPCQGANDAWTTQRAARAAGAALGAVALAAAVVAAVLSHGELADQPPAPTPPGPAKGAPPRVHPNPPPAAPTREEMLRNWPCFRGPDGNGVAFTTGAPADWDAAAGTRVLWKTKIPKPGYSSPVVWSNLVVVTGGDKEGCAVYGIDANTGAILWQTPAPPAEGKGLPDNVADNAGYAAPTPATDGARVFAFFAAGELLCLDFGGRVLWSKQLGVPENHYGHSSSLLARDGILYVQRDDAASPRLMALDCETGAGVWEAERSAMSWASPICVNTGSRAELILADCEALTSYDPAGGSVLWRAACLRGEVGTSPAFADGMVFAANDGAPAAAIALSNRTARIAWKSDAAAPDTASPLAAGGYVFLATSGGTVVCLRARTGEVAWEHEFGEGFYSSPIAVEGRVYAQDRSGVTHVFAVAGEYRGMSEGRVGEQTGATPAFAGKRIYIRGAERLFCIGERSGP